MGRENEFQSILETSYSLYIKLTSLKSLSSSSLLILIVFYFIVLTSRYRSFSPFENSYLGFEALFLAFARCGGKGPEFRSSIFCALIFYSGVIANNKIIYSSTNN